MIQEIKISLLGQHPLNPRKEYKDIDELAQSIKEKGILQNLLVVPDDAQEGHYLVIGGNRRLLAARKAGIESAPCVIRTDLTDKDIAQIMLTENMQRKDLTPVEEAYGMQMCIQDYGIKVDELAEGTGLSKTTIQHRLNIAKLDKEILQEADPAQITLKDFIELEKLKNIENRNEAAKLLGKPGFSQKVNDLKTKEQIDSWKKKIEKVLDEFATEVKKTTDRHKYVRGYYYRYNGEGDLPEEGVFSKDEGEYAYTVGYSSITLFRVLTDEELKDEYEDNDDEDEESEEREEERNTIFGKYYHRRFDFMMTCKEELKGDDLMRHLLRAALNEPAGWVNRAAWKELHGNEINSNRDILIPDASKNGKNITRYLYCRLEDGDDLGLMNWRGEYVDDHPRATELYKILEDLGYITDETEDAMLDGTWELYEGNDEEDDEEEDDEE